ncbi:hypothetical protein AYX07_06340 [Thermoactinomyces sp. AS95]|nr:hypothetical protein AYX07_06340 [Thermoactinomyces sp. AS95]MBI0386678.1 hypothetical protein [Thermoactinomyces sp. CICC 24227]
MPGMLTAMAFMVKEIIAFVSYIKNNAFPHPLSSEEEEKALKAMARGDTKARNKLIEHNLRLVAHIVNTLETQPHVGFVPIIHRLAPFGSP